jgi:hypothetical protein
MRRQLVSRFVFTFGSAIALASVLLVVGPAAAAPSGKLEFNRDIRPILSDKCFACHGPDSAARKADLRLDQREAAIEFGALKPGEPSSSPIVERIFSEEPDLQMPPADSHKRLSPEQKETLKRWIAEGAEYQPHWSFIPPGRPALPAVKDQAWVRNPIDAFILARLEAEGLSPAPEADRRTLIRRLSLDLTGLPPKPELVEEFVADASPEAYEKVVNRLLESPHWGEHRGRYWLDAARYADTHGIHFDNYREMWSYRDWVISAFNSNMPFDQFTLEQLAGDLLPAATLDQKIASGFNRCNITTSEGGAISEEYLVLYARERTETTSAVWMALTTGCATCHDHKFDPVSQKEFYQLTAFFNNTTQAAMDGNIKDTPPIMLVPQPADRQRWDSVGTELVQAKGAVEARMTAAKPDFDTWLSSASAIEAVASVPKDSLHFHAPFNDGGKVAKATFDGAARDLPVAESATWQDGGPLGKALVTQGAAVELSDIGDFDISQPYSCSAWIKLPPNDGQGAICARMDTNSAYRGWDVWVQQRRVGMHLINLWPDNALKVVAQPQVPANEWTHVAITYDGSGKASGVKVFYNGQAQATLIESDKLSATTKATVPFKVGQRHSSDPLSGLGLQDLRIYKKSLSEGEVAALAKNTKLAAILAKGVDQRTDAEKNEVFAWWLATLDEPFKAASANVAQLEKEQADIKARGTVAHVMNEKAEEPVAFVLHRGDYDKRRDPVKAEVPGVLPKLAADAPRNRLGLAKWLLQPEHPLTARVTVNRFWQEVFGTGLVRTTGDFGVTGEQPSHPELLDWLAVEFREKNWDVKQFFKLVVMSNAYRQAAIATDEKLEKDPASRLLSRGPRFRMDAEMVRDYALAASELLVPKLGGPSVKPYMPEGVWEAVAMIGSNTRDYRRDTGENLYRRSMYTFWKRSAPPAAMDVLNAPSREVCTVRRDRTNTPLQALVTMNDEQFVEAARVLAQSVLLKGGDTDDAKLDALANRLLARSFKAEELPIVRQSLSDLTAYYKANPEDAKKLVAVGESKADPAVDVAALAAWTMLSNEVMNLDEVLNK